MVRDRRSYSVFNRRSNGATSHASRDLSRHRNGGGGIQKRRQSTNDERVFDDERPFHNNNNKKPFRTFNNFRNNYNHNNYNNNRRFSDRNTLRNTMRNNLRNERNRINTFRRTTLHSKSFRGKTGATTTTRYQSKFDRSRLGVPRQLSYRRLGDRKVENRFRERRRVSSLSPPLNYLRSRSRSSRRASYDSDTSLLGYSSRMTPSSYDESPPPPSPPSPPPLPPRPQTPPPPKTPTTPTESHFQPNLLPMKTLVITGIKDSRDPRTEPLINLLIKIGEKLNVTLHRSDIDSISRLEDKDKIKVVFVHSSIKKLLMKNIRLKKCLSTKEIDLHYDQQIYLNDELSVFGEFVFRKARYLKARRIIENTWTVDGKVLYKVRPGDSPRRCQTLEELLDLEM